MSPILGPTTQAMIEDPAFGELVWQLTPASLAVKISRGAWHPWPYLQLLSRKLVDVAMGRCRRLIIVLPPRHGKSELVSKWFPVWYFNAFPSRKIILASYEAEFAASWGGKVRDIILENQDSLHTRFKTRNPAMHGWVTSMDGTMNCAGVGGPITGRGANVLIIDDYVKNMEEAKSRTMRQKTVDWWTSTARTRLEPTEDGVPAGVVIMATRWDSKDLIGQLIDPEFGSEKGVREPWEVFCLPATADPESERHYARRGCVVNNVRMDSINKLSIRQLQEIDRDPQWRDVVGRKKDDPLCPDRYDAKDLMLIRGSVGERDWVALYQQRPGDEVDDGNVYYSFDRERNCREWSYDERLPVCVSLDFNVNPMTAVIGQYDPGVGARMTERVHILEEIYMPNSHTMAMMERLIMELAKYKRGYSLKVEFYGDCAGSQRTPNSNKTNWQLVAESMALDSSLHYSFFRRKTNPRIGDRVNAVNSMLLSADKNVRLTMNDVKCPHLVNDMVKVRWQVDSSGNTTGLLDKGNPELTHISDALGYFVEYRFGLRSKAGAKKGFLQ